MFAYLCLVGLLFCAPITQAATQAAIDAMRDNSLAWLITNQKFDGSWQGVEGTGIQTTSIALDALSNAGINSQVYARGLAWLANSEPQSVDSLSRQIVTMANAGMDVTDKLTTLISWRNNTFTWGAYDRYSISYPDTPLASSAIRKDTAVFNANIAELSNAMCAIIATQKTGDVSIAGSWSYFPGPNGAAVPASPGSVLPTVYNLLEMSAYNDLSPSINCGTVYQFIDIINVGLDWLISQRRNIDGGFGDNGASTALETALAYSIIAKIRPGDITLTSAQDYMVSTQSIDGSWQGDTLVAAVATTTLPSVTLTDTDNDGIPDSVEAVLGTNPAIADSRDLLPSDGIFTFQDYQNSNLQPNGVNYVPFRDHFDDYEYEDRWYLTSVDANMIYSVFETGTELLCTTQQPAAACNGWVLESFASVDVTNAVFHARIRPEGFGTTSLGLVQSQNYSNRIEVRFDNDTAPYLELRSWDAGVETSLPLATSTTYMGADVDIRIVKSGDQYYLFVNGMPQGNVTNTGLGNTALRPFIIEESCLEDGGFVDSRFDLIEILIDRDADGRADLYEDANLDGVVNAGESDPLNPDMDNDTILDGFDNCLFKTNTAQRDTDGDGYGNYCDPDFDNNLVVNASDLAFFKTKFFSADSDADLNGDGVVNAADLAILKTMFFKPPGSSGLVP